MQGLKQYLRQLPCNATQKMQGKGYAMALGVSVVWERQTKARPQAAIAEAAGTQGRAHSGLGAPYKAPGRAGGGK